MENCLDLAVRTEGTAGSVVPTIERSEDFNDDVVVSPCDLLAERDKSYLWALELEAYDQQNG